MKRPMIGWNQEKSHFSNTGKILLKQEFSDGLQIHEQRYYYTFDNSYYLLRAFKNTTQIFHEIITSGSSVSALGALA